MNIRKPNPRRPTPTCSAARWPAAWPSPRPRSWRRAPRPRCAARSADSAPAANAHGHRDQPGHRLLSRSAGRPRRQLRARRPAAGHLPDRRDAGGQDQFAHGHAAGRPDRHAGPRGRRPRPAGRWARSTVVGIAMPETKTSEVATYVSTKQIEALPQGNRNFLAFADIVPGVVFTTENDGSTKLRSGAQSSNGINVFIDGVGQKNYVLKGGITGQDSSRGNPFPQLGDRRIQGDHPQLQGRVRPGQQRRDRRGDPLGHQRVPRRRRSSTTPTRACAQPTLREDRQRRRRSTSTDKQYGVAFGGPIIQDRMHFFFTYEAKEIDAPARRHARPGLHDRRACRRSFQALAAATTSAPFEEDLFFGKIDWSPGDDHLVELTRQVPQRGGTDQHRRPEHRRPTAPTRTTRTPASTCASSTAPTTGSTTRTSPTRTPRSVRAPATIGPGYDAHRTHGNRATRSSSTPAAAAISRTRARRAGASRTTSPSIDWDGGRTRQGRHQVQGRSTINAFEQQPYNPQFFYDINSSLTTPYCVSLRRR